MASRRLGEIPGGDSREELGWRRRSRPAEDRASGWSPAGGIEPVGARQWLVRSTDRAGQASAAASTFASYRRPVQFGSLKKRRPHPDRAHGDRRRDCEREAEQDGALDGWRRTPWRVERRAPPAAPVPRRVAPKPRPLAAAPSFSATAACAARRAAAMWTLTAGLVFDPIICARSRASRARCGAPAPGSIRNSWPFNGAGELSSASGDCRPGVERVARCPGRAPRAHATHRLRRRRPSQQRRPGGAARRRRRQRSRSRWRRGERRVSPECLADSDQTRLRASVSARLFGPQFGQLGGETGLKRDHGDAWRIGAAAAPAVSRSVPAPLARFVARATFAVSASIRSWILAICPASASNRRDRG